MSALRDWARLDARWYLDPVLLAAAEECEAAFHLWPVLVGKAKHESHEIENPSGAFVVTPRRLAQDAWVAIDDIRPALDALADGDLIAFAVEHRNALRISLIGFEKWQTPRKSNAEAKARQRWDASRQKTAIGHGDGMAKSRPSQGVVMPDRRQETETGDVDQDKTLAAHTPKAAATKQRKPRSRKPLKRVSDPELDARASACFEWYCDLFGKVGAYAITLTQARYDAIVWALTDYSGEQVATCLRGYHSEPWRLEQPGRHEIATLLRNPEQVEAGIALGLAVENKNAVNQNGGVDLEATRRWYIEQGFTPEEIDRQLGDRGAVA